MENMRKFEETDEPREFITFMGDGTAVVYKRSLFTNKMHKIRLPLTKEQFMDWYSRRVLIQHAMPDLSKDEREFFLTGSTPEEWENAFGKEEDQDQ
jgi:hypothetical protein